MLKHSSFTQHSDNSQDSDLVENLIHISFKKTVKSTAIFMRRAIVKQKFTNDEHPREAFADHVLRLLTMLKGRRMCCAYKNK